MAFFTFRPDLEHSDVTFKIVRPQRQRIAYSIAVAFGYIISIIAVAHYSWFARNQYLYPMLLMLLLFVGVATAFLPGTRKQEISFDLQTHNYLLAIGRPGAPKSIIGSTKNVVVKASYFRDTFEIDVSDDSKGWAIRIASLGNRKDSDAFVEMIAKEAGICIAET